MTKESLLPLGADRLAWRQVGPSRGGRVVAVAGDPVDRMTAWMGACSGGVWRTTDGGLYWHPMADGQFEASSVGAIEVAASDPNVVWVGTGESQVRNNVVPGNGVYRTTDAGRTWDHLGLEETRHISRVRIHPDDPDVAWVGALGDIFGPNPERGVYRTTDGGRTWELVLHVSDRAGCADLVVDPTNPRILYATIWQARRSPWDMVSGGEDSGLWRSSDGGDTWTCLDDQPGFATGVLGRMGVAVSAARAGRVWVLVEAADDQGGLYRSDDAGQTWEQTSTHRGIQGRPWYYSHVYADPVDPQTVWSLNLWAWRSDDGGATWTQVQTPHGDNHDLWIDPRDRRHMVTGNDGGASVSFDGGATWSDIFNQPTAQIYRFDVNRTFPHDVYGTQQDNSGIRVPTRSWKGAIRWPDSQELGEAEAGDVAVDPRDDRWVFLGGAGFGHPGPLLRFDTVTEQAQDVGVWPEYFMGVGAIEQRHRFGWTYPIEFSPHDPTCLYVGGERVFASRDRGMSWEAISDDLTRNDPDKQGPSGGPISRDTSGAEVYCTIHALAESPLTPGELWVGTDDGLVHLSTNGGDAWSDVTPPELPKWATVQRIEPSHHDPGTVYVAAHKYRLQDRRPLLFRSRDHGQSWDTIVTGLPEDDWTRTVREDPEVASLLYAGTEHRPWVSLDGGDSWTEIRNNLPDVPVYDLQVCGHELVAGTHGRGFWILNDVTPLRAAAVGELGEHVAVVDPPVTVRYPTPNGFDMPGEGMWIGGFPGVPLGGAAFRPQRQPDGTTRNVMLLGGTNPPDGALVHWWLPPELSADADQVELRITDEDVVLATFWHDPPDDGRAREDDDRLPLQAGLNSFAWDLRIEGPLAAADGDGKREVVHPGPRVAPGTYGIEVRVADAVVATTIEVVRDERLFATDDDLRAQYDTLVVIRDLLGAIHDGIGRARGLRSRLDGLDRAAVPEALHQEIDDLRTELDAIERVLTNPDMQDHGDQLKMAAGLDQKLVLLPEIVVELSDTRPTSGVLTVLAELEEEAGAALDGLDELVTGRVRDLDEALHEARLSPLGLPMGEEQE